MKSFLSIFVLFYLFSNSIFSQDFEEPVIAKKTEISGSEWFLDYVTTYSKQYGTNKYFYKFIPDGGLLMSQSQKLENDQWVNVYLYTYHYDVPERYYYNYRIYQVWQNDQWVNSTKTSYNWDENKNNTGNLSEKWVTDEWVNVSRNTVTFTQTNKRLSVLMENWTNNQWVNYYTTNYTYDENDNNTEITSKQWKNDQWVLLGKSIFEYNEQNQVIKVIQQQWKNDQWVNVNGYTQGYDEWGNESVYTAIQWKNDQWVNSYRTTELYDKDGKYLSYFYEEWIDEQWVPYERYNVSYDENGKEISTLGEQFVNGVWENWYKYLNTYDANRNVSEINKFDWVFGAWEEGDGNGLGFNDYFGNFFRFSGYKIEVSWNTGTDVREIEDISNILIYPNPASEFIEISGMHLNPRFKSWVDGCIDEVKIYNILGECILTVEQTSPSIQRIDVSGLLAGVYFIKLGKDIKFFVKG